MRPRSAHNRGNAVSRQRWIAKAIKSNAEGLSKNTGTIFRMATCNHVYAFARVYTRATVLSINYNAKVRDKELARCS